MSEVLKVAGTTNTSRLASTIVKIYENNETCELVAIGAGAVNQAIKAVAVANGLVGSNGISFSVKPCFFILDLSQEKEDGKSEVTALRFKVAVEK